jgi:hypothetical protein
MLPFHKSIKYVHIKVEYTFSRFHEQYKQQQVIYFHSFRYTNL